MESHLMNTQTGMSGNLVEMVFTWKCIAMENGMMLEVQVQVMQTGWSVKVCM